MGDGKSFMEHLNDYMSEVSELKAGFGVTIKRLLERCERRTKEELEGGRTFEALEAAEEFLSLSELLYYGGAALAVQSEGADDFQLPERRPPPDLQN